MLTGTRINTLLLVLTLMTGVTIVAMLATGARGGPLDPPGPPASTGITNSDVVLLLRGVGTWSETLNDSGGCLSARFSCVMDGARRARPRDGACLAVRDVDCCHELGDGVYRLSSSERRRTIWLATADSTPNSEASSTTRQSACRRACRSCRGWRASRDYWTSTLAPGSLAAHIDVDGDTANYRAQDDSALLGHWCVRGPE